MNRFYPLTFPVVFALAFIIVPVLSFWAMIFVGQFVDGPVMPIAKNLGAFYVSLGFSGWWYLSIFFRRGIVITWLPTGLATVVYWWLMKQAFKRGGPVLRSRARFMGISLLIGALAGVLAYGVCAFAFDPDFLAPPGPAGGIRAAVILPAAAILGGIVGATGGAFARQRRDVINH